MNGREVSYIFLFFSAIVVVAEPTGQVWISGTTVSLYCPFGPEGITWQKEGAAHDGNAQTLELSEYTYKKDGFYSCIAETSQGKQFHYFYIKAKVCSGCVDLDMLLAGLLIFIDVMVTLVIVALVYFCARRKTGAPPPQRAAQPRQARGQGRGPPVPDPDYQMLNPATRSNDLYAQAQRR